MKKPVLPKGWKSPFKVRPSNVGSFVEVVDARGRKWSWYIERDRGELEAYYLSLAFKKKSADRK